MNSKNIHSKRVVANNIFTGIVVLILVGAIALVVGINIKDHGKGSYSKGTWNAVSDSDMFGDGGNLISVYPQQNNITNDTKITGTITLKGFFVSAQGDMVAIIELPSGSVSLKQGESAGNITLTNIEEGLVTVNVDGTDQYLSLDEPSIDLQ